MTFAVVDRDRYWFMWRLVAWSVSSHCVNQYMFTIGCSGINFFWYTSKHFCYIDHKIKSPVEFIYVATLLSEIRHEAMNARLWQFNLAYDTCNITMRCRTPNIGSMFPWMRLLYNLSKSFLVNVDEYSNPSFRIHIALEIILIVQMYHILLFCLWPPVNRIELNFHTYHLSNARKQCNMILKLSFLQHLNVSCYVALVVVIRYIKTLATKVTHSSQFLTNAKYLDARVN